MITALYDCRSKQEYIYRTNKIREISGASQILSHVYEWMIDAAREHGITIRNTWREDHQNGKNFDLKEFEQSADDGIVVYEGGGNLYVIYKDKPTYISVNRIFSRILLEKTYSVSIIAACTETTENFAEDRRRLYEAKNQSKNLGTCSSPCNVLPFTQLERMTLMPVVSKKDHKDRTQEIQRKREAYKLFCKETDEHHTENLEELVWEKGDDSLLAVIYIDGNDMGNKIAKCTADKSDYSSCVKALRQFSLQTDECFVNRPLEAIKRCLNKKNQEDAKLIEKNQNKRHQYRRIIGGGDEITIICRAKDAADIVKAYFEELAKTPPLAEDSVNASCAGIAIFHSHAPFADVYKIAEACCESGKKKTRESGSQISYIDFHYCHAGITNELDVLREEQEKDYTARPYSVEEFHAFCDLIDVLSDPCIGRSNAKTLGEAVVKGEAAYQFEVERICSRDTVGDFTRLVKEDAAKNKEHSSLKHLIYDASVVYDLWSKKEKEDA